MENGLGNRCKHCGRENVPAVTICVFCGHAVIDTGYSAELVGPPIPSPAEGSIYSTPTAAQVNPEVTPRGGCLTAWLCLMIVSAALNVLTLPLAVFVTRQLAAMGHDVSVSWTIIWMRGGFGLVLLVAAVAMWHGKKWGVFLFFLLQAVSFGLAWQAFGSDIDAGPLLMLSVIVGGVFYIVVRRRWAYFR